MVKTHFIEKLESHFFQYFFFNNRAVFEIMWKSIVELGRPQMTIWRMRIACWIQKVIETQAACVMLAAFPPQEWLHERASTSRYRFTDTD